MTTQLMRSDHYMARNCPNMSAGTLVDKPNHTVFVNGSQDKK